MNSSNDSDSGDKSNSTKTSQPELLGKLLDKYELEDKGGYITREFQDYGYRLACEMGEEDKKSMYIKLAKSENRALLERARSFVLDAPNVKHKGRLFMWALSKLKKGEPLADQE